jgi:hypothetical protein
MRCMLKKFKQMMGIGMGHETLDGQARSRILTKFLIWAYAICPAFGLQVCLPQSDECGGLTRWRVW